MFQAEKKARFLPYPYEHADKVPVVADAEYKVTRVSMYFDSVTKLNVLGCWTQQNQIPSLPCFTC